MSTVSPRPDSNPESMFREELDQLHAEIAAMRLEVQANREAHERLYSEVREQSSEFATDHLIIAGKNGVVEIGDVDVDGGFGIRVHGRGACRGLSASMTVDDGTHSLPSVPSAVVLVGGPYGNVEIRATWSEMEPPAVIVNVDSPGAGPVAKLTAHHAGFADGQVGVVDLDGGWHGALLLDDDRPGNHYVLVTYDQLDVVRADGSDWDRDSWDCES